MECEPYEMLSGSWAHWDNALQVLTSSWLFVPVSRLTKGDTPPDFLMDARFSGSCAHSANAPTVFTRTSSFGSLNKLTNDSIALSSWNRFTFSLLIEHFQIAPFQFAITKNINLLLMEIKICIIIFNTSMIFRPSLWLSI